MSLIKDNSISNNAGSMDNLEQ